MKSSTGAKWVCMGLIQASFPYNPDPTEPIKALPSELAIYVQYCYVARSTRSSYHFELPFFSISSAHKALSSNTWQFQWKVMQMHSCPTNQNTHQAPTKPCTAWHHSVAVLRPVQVGHGGSGPKTRGGRSKFIHTS